MDTKKMLELSRSVEYLKENKVNLNNLFDYKLKSEGGESGCLSFVDFGGPSAHVRYYPNDREFVERVRISFLLQFDKEIIAAETELKKLVN